MRVGIVPVLDRSWGGVYQYSVTLLHALTRLKTADEFVVFAEAGTDLDPDVAALPFEFVEMPSQASALGAAYGRLPHWVRTPLHGVVSAARQARASRRSSAPEGFAWAQWFARFDLDLLLFTIEDDRAHVSGVPYIVVLHDLQHRLQPDLPEFADRVETDRRDARMRSSVTGATLVLVDSETGREDVLDCYADTGIAPDAVVPLPFVPAHYVGTDVTPETRRRVRDSYSLPERYLFYPAQFWPHKNHRRIVEALGTLAAEGLRIPLVLVGSKSGTPLRAETFSAMMAKAREVGVEDLVCYRGYVPDADMAALYAMATALVMPTFFGPTNIPVIEAWEQGCPVVTSDIRGIREQVADAAVLVDPESVASIAAGIRDVVLDEGLRARLVERGRARLSAYTIADFAERLGSILTEAGTRIGAR